MENDTLTNLACVVGAVFMIGGAAWIAACLIGFAWDLLGTIWIDASYKWRGIVRGEGLILEYRRERKDYLAWKEAHNGE